MRPLATSTIEWFRFPEDPICYESHLFVFTKCCKIQKVYWCEETKQFFIEDSPFLDEVKDVIFWAYIPNGIYPIQIISTLEAGDALLKKNRERGAYFY